MSSRLDRISIVGKGLRYKLVIIESLVFVLPFLVISYIFFSRGGNLQDVSHLVILAMILVLVLAGLMILRQVFDRFFAVASFMKRAENGEIVSMAVQKDTAELQDISLSFNNIMVKLQNTTDDLGRRILELFVIKELTEIANQQRDVDGLLIALLNKAMSVTKSQIGSVFEVGSDGNRLRLVGFRGPGEGPAKDAFISVEDSLMKFVVTEKKNLLVRDIEKDPRTLRPNLARYGQPSFLSMPIFIEDKVAAVINLAHKETAKPFDGEDEQILSIMLGEISFAIENARLRMRIEENLKALQRHAADLEREVAERKRIEENLRENEKRYMELSITDGLTGLYNRRHFYSQLETEIERSLRYGRSLSLLLLDIDDFKVFNDAYGHLEGDKVLVRMAETIRKTLRRMDSVYRYGGEEFVVLLPETSGEQGVTIAERIRSEFGKKIFSPAGDGEVRVTASIGVAQFIPGEELEVFVKRADDNMYRAKETGKDRVFLRNERV